jgi:hypothetical protein
MSTTKNDTSDIKKAAEQANGQEIEKNLEDNKKVDAPESLNEEEQTSFINDELRTDK